MKKTYTLILLVVVINLTAQNWAWLQDFQTHGFTNTFIDPQGVSYTLVQYKNSFNESAYFSPYDDSLHTKIITRDANNVLLWEKEFFCTGISRAKIAFKNSTEPYLTGSFSGTFVSPDLNMVSNGETDIFLIHLSNTGYFSLTKQFGGPGNELGVCAFDSRGYLIVTGGYTNSGTFGNLVYIGNSSQDFFLLQYDTNNNLVWSERAVTPNTSGYCFGDEIKTDSLNNIYVTISGDAMLENNNGISVGAYYASELIKFNSGGVYRKKFAIGSSYPSVYQKGWEIDNNGNVYYASVIGSAHTSYMSHIVKQDSLAQVLWQNYYGAGGYNTPDFYLTGFHLDSQGNYYFTAVGDSMVGTTNQLLSKGNSANGNVIWKYYQKITNESATIKTDINNNLYIASSFRDSLTLGSFNAYSSDPIYYNSFLTKMAAEPVGIKEIVKTANTLVVSPNPCNGYFTLQLNKMHANSLMYIYDIFGDCILSKKLDRPEDQLITLPVQAKGIYFVEVQNGAQKYSSKLIVN